MILFGAKIRKITITSKEKRNFFLDKMKMRLFPDASSLSMFFTIKSLETLIFRIISLWSSCHSQSEYPSHSSQSYDLANHRGLRLEI